MQKKIFFLFLAIIVFNSTHAQRVSLKPGVLMYFIKDLKGMVSTKDSADYIRLLMPVDTSTGRILYPVREYYKTGKIKRSTYSTNRYARQLVFDGACVNYYPNGHKKEVLNYRKGKIRGGFVSYYLNGKVHSSEYYDDYDRHFFNACYDSTGKVTADNGNGKWLMIDESSVQIGYGDIKDSLQTGEWHVVNATDTSRYDIIYVNGKPTTGTSYDKTGKAYPFKEAKIESKYIKGGDVGFAEFLSRNIRYPEEDKRNNIQGKVLVTFVVEKNGSLSEIRVLSAPDQSLGYEAVRVVRLSPAWHPAALYGMPVSVQYTVPIKFSLNER